MRPTPNSIFENNILPRFENIHNTRFSIERRIDTTPVNPRQHHYHSYYELYYLYSGERYYFIQDKTYHITGGAFVLINPYEIHQTGNLGSFGYDRMLIHFSKELLADYLDVEPGINPYENLEKEIHIISLEPWQQNFVETLLSTMEAEFKNNGLKENAYIKLTLLQLLLFLNSCKPGDGDEALPQINATQKTIFEIIGYINNSFSENITLESISDKYFLSTYYFSRTFKEVTGFNFVEYLNNVRIKEAKKLLLNTDRTINEISSNVGFNSNTHFGRVFKSMEGLSPSEYRKQAGVFPSDYATQQETTQKRK